MTPAEAFDMISKCGIFVVGWGGAPSTSSPSSFPARTALIQKAGRQWALTVSTHQGRYSQPEHATRQHATLLDAIEAVKSEEWE